MIYKDLENPLVSLSPHSCEAGLSLDWILNMDTDHDCGISHPVINRIRDPNRGKWSYAHRRSPQDYKNFNEDKLSGTCIVNVLSKYIEEVFSISHVVRSQG